MKRIVFATLIPLIAIGCRSTATHESVTESTAQIFSDLGNHQRKITTDSRIAQQYFDQGLTWTFSFNHDEAIRSFQEAARLDPNCPMPWWGVALCNGPHYNNPLVDEAHAKAAWEALQQAQALRANASPTERKLIDALAKRYAYPQPANRRPLDEAYAAAMKPVWEANRSDADIGTLYAESLMNLQPWDLWTTDDQPKGRTSEILAVLEEVQQLDPKHPGACHLYIHACEAGPNPEKALAAADTLRTLLPASGHMVHMPSHIDVRVGQWHKAALQNQRAIKADAAYRKKSPQQGFYRLYMAHDHHFLAFVDMMRGRSGAALTSMRDMVSQIPASFVAQMPEVADLFMIAPIDVMIRFGQWDDVLAEPAPPTNLPYSTCFYHFARGVAFAAKKQVPEARREQALFRAKMVTIPEDKPFAISPMRSVLNVADKMLEGEIQLGAGDFEAAIVALRDAAAAEDKLLYTEPPEWMHPVRQPLGAALLAVGRVEEAERVYREDLKHWPENGWSLHGLAKALRARGENVEAARVQERFDNVWRGADIQIDSSCLCVPGTIAAGTKSGGEDCCVVSASSE
ncbi:MAG: hypothetical protein AB7N71_03750 [Phycisphaerae bacterium]